MTQRFTYTACLCWGGDIQTGEAEVTCTYSVDWGSPGSRETPPEPAQVEDIVIDFVDGSPWQLSNWRSFGLTIDEAHETLVEKLISDREDELIEHATEEVVADEDRS